MLLRCPVWVVRVGGDDGELRLWHYIYEDGRPNIYEDRRIGGQTFMRIHI